MADGAPAHGGYRIEELDDERAIVRLASAVDYKPHTDEEQEIEGLLQRCERVAVDASSCVSLRPEWLRFFRRLCLVADRFDSHVTVVGLSDTLRDQADALRLTKGKERMNLGKTLDDAWK